MSPARLYGYGSINYFKSNMETKFRNGRTHSNSRKRVKFTGGPASCSSIGKRQDLHLSLGFALSCRCVGVSQPRAAVEKPSSEPVELTEVRAAREKEVAERITGPYEAGPAELVGKFTTALERAAGEAKKAGKLDEAGPGGRQTPVDRESADSGRYGGDARDPEKLRAIYRGQLARVAEPRPKSGSGKTAGRASFWGAREARHRCARLPSRAPRNESIKTS